MVKFYDTDYSYNYPFAAVSLAYFLRYPNPYSRHVASTDTISRHFDPATQRLTTVRLHLKRSRMPPAVVKFLPTGAATSTTGEDGSTQSLILEESVVDVREGWMRTESRNLDWNNVLSVIERQTYSRPATVQNASGEVTGAGIASLDEAGECTHVNVSVTLKSRIGEQIRRRRQKWGEQATATSVIGNGEEEGAVAAPKKGWFSTWSSGAARTAIETISLQRTEKSQPKARQGMTVVLERLRSGGLVSVLEGMRRDAAVEL